MGAFTEAEVAYLEGQRLMRFATASPSGRPDVTPVTFWLDGDDIVTGGFDITRTVRYGNVRHNPRATVVVDDLVSVKPWTPRGVKVIGSVSIEVHDGEERFRIQPDVVISWGVNDASPGLHKMDRRTILRDS